MIVQQAFDTRGERAGALLLPVVAINELVMPIVFKQALIRAGEVRQRAS